MNIKIIALILSMLMVLSIGAMAESDNQQDDNQGDDNGQENGGDSSDNEGGNTGDDFSSDEKDESSDTDDNESDDSNGDDSTDDNLEEELEELEEVSEEEEEEILEDASETAEATDEMLLAQAGVTSDMAAELDEVEETIGHRQFVLNLQLKHRLQLALIGMKETVAYVTEEGLDATELQALFDQVKTIETELNESNLDNSGFSEKVKEIKDIVKQFHDKVHEMLTEEQIQELKDRIKDRVKEEAVNLGQLMKKERAVREYHNRKAIRNTVQKIVKEAKEIRASSGRILDLTNQLKNLNQLRNKFLGTNVTKEAFEQYSEQWKEQVKKFSEKKEQVRAKAKRADALKKAVAVRSSLRERKAAGDDTTADDKDFQQIQKELREMKDNMPTQKEVQERLDNLRNRLGTMRERVQTQRERLQTQRDARAAGSRGVVGEGTDEVTENE